MPEFLLPEWCSDGIPIVAPLLGADTRYGPPVIVARGGQAGQRLRWAVQCSLQGIMTPQAQDVASWLGRRREVARLHGQAYVSNR